MKILDLIPLTKPIKINFLIIFLGLTIIMLFIFINQTFNSHPNSILNEDIDCFNLSSIGLVGNSKECQGLLIVDEMMLYQSILRGEGIEIDGVIYSAYLPSGVFTGQITNMSAKLGEGFILYDFNEDIGYWDVSNVVDMQNMFDNASMFNQYIGNWNVSNVENMRSLFDGATSFNQDISNWNVSNVVDMYGMFALATSFNQDISNWNVSNVVDMGDLFFEATSFNQDISSWDVSSVLYFEFMFDGATSFNQNISSWDVSSAIDCTGFDLSTLNWDDEFKPQFLISCEEDLFED